MFGAKQFSTAVFQENSADMSDSFEMCSLGSSKFDVTSKASSTAETSFKSNLNPFFHDAEECCRGAIDEARESDEKKSTDFFDEFSPRRVLRKEFFDELNPAVSKVKPSVGIRSLQNPSGMSKRVMKGVEEPPTFSCPRCLYSSRVKENLLRHEKLHDPATVFHSCSKCPFRTSDRQALDKHMDLIHSDNIEWHQCPLCPLRTSRPLQDHIGLIHDPQVEWFSCSFCFYRSTAKKRLENHLWTRHRLVEVEEKV